MVRLIWKKRNRRHQHRTMKLFAFLINPLAKDKRWPKVEGLKTRNCVSVFNRLPACDARSLIAYSSPKPVVFVFDRESLKIHSNVFKCQHKLVSRLRPPVLRNDGVYPEGRENDWLLFSGLDLLKYSKPGKIVHISALTIKQTNLPSSTSRPNSYILSSEMS